MRRHQELSQALASPRASFTHMGSSGPYQEVISRSDGVAVPRVPSFLSPCCHSQADASSPVRWNYRVLQGTHVQDFSLTAN